jgi:hypothetical protein
MRSLSLLCGLSALTVASSDCTASDASLKNARGYICDSLVGQTTPWCLTDVSDAGKDWPSQSVYMKNLLDLLIAPTTCLNTSYAKDTAVWLDAEIQDPAVAGSWGWTYLVFQVTENKNSVRFFFSTVLVRAVVLGHATS